MKYEDYLDEDLVILNKEKNINVYSILYERYKNYGYAIIRETLNKTSYFKALFEEKDAIVYDALIGSVKAFDKNRGSFRSLFYSITKRETIKRIIAYNKNPLSDYVSLDEEIRNTDDLVFADSTTFIDKSADTKIDLDYIDEKKLVDEIFDRNKTRVRKMIELKKEGYSYIEIADKLNCTIKTVYEVFYRIRKRLKKDIN